MSRILRRPMFRGGKVSSYGTGIASGLGRQGYAPGGEVLEFYENIKKRIPVPAEQGLTTGDYLRIASAGLDILGQPGQRGGFSGALAAASKPLAQLGVDLGSSIDTRRQKQLQNREDLARTLTGAQAEFEIGKMKADKKTATEISLQVIDDYYNGSGLDKRFLKLAIVAANPRAFAQQNPNFMFAGATLHLPSLNQIQAMVLGIPINENLKSYEKQADNREIFFFGG